MALAEVWAGDTSRKRECVFWLTGMKVFIPTRARCADGIPNFLRAVYNLDAHGASHRFGCDKQWTPISQYLCLATGLATTILYSLFALQKMRLYHEGVLLGALIYHILVHKICCQKVDCIDICIPPNNTGMFGGVGQEIAEKKFI